MLSIGPNHAGPEWPSLSAGVESVWVDFGASAAITGSDQGAQAAASFSSKDSCSLSYTDDGIRGRISLPGVGLETVSAIDSTFIRLSVPGWSHAGLPGQAELPVLRTPLIVPAGTEVLAEVTAEKSIRLDTAYPICPVQAPLPDAAQIAMNANGQGSSAGAATFEYDIDDYGDPAAAKTDLLRVSDPAIARGTSVVLLEVSPFQYDPGKDQITVATDLTFSLRFVETGPSAEEVGKSEPNLPPEAAAADYLILTADEFYDDVLRLARWKQLKGFRTFVVQLSDVGSGAGSVRKFIRDAYHTDTQTSYVLLVGDHEEMPSNYVAGYYISDHPYACVDGDDYLPDLAIGRLTVSTQTEAASVIDKVLSYDRNPDPGQWYDDALIAGFFQDEEESGVDGFADRWFMETSMHVHDYLRDVRGMTIHTALTADGSGGPPYYYREADFPHRISVAGDPPYPVPTDVVELWTTPGQATADVVSAINAGVGLVQHRDHGNETGWSHPSFNTSDVEALSNGSKTPVVFSINCSTGTFDYYGGDSFAEALLKHSDGGAVGVLAATNTSYSGFNDLLTHGLYTGLWPDYDPTHSNNLYPNSMRPAEALNFAKYYMLQYGGANPYSQLEFNEFLWFGDPEMMLRTATPAPLSVVHPPAIQLDMAADVTVEVADAGGAVEGARVCISMAGTDDYWVGLTDAEGRVTLAGLTPKHIGTYDVVVTAYNAVPYEGTISGVTTGPFSRLVEPAGGGATNTDRGYVDVEWLDFFAAGLDPTTIDAADLTVEGVTIGTPIRQDGNVWRYPYNGDLTPGVIEVVVNSGQVQDRAGDWNIGHVLRFIYDVEGPEGHLRAPAADSEVFDDLGYVDVTFHDVGEAGVDPSTIDAADVTIEGVAISGPPVDRGGGVWRYHYTGDLPSGIVTVRFTAGGVLDRAGNPNPGRTQTFTFSPLEIATPASLPPAALDEPYRFRLEAQGGVAPYEWSPSAPVVITECGLGGPDYIEIQNTSDRTVDTEGWVVAVSNDYTDIEHADPTYWHLPASIPGRRVLYRTDDPNDHPWENGTNILWNPGNAGWAAILDRNGSLVDFVAWHWMSANLAAMNVQINGHDVVIGDAFSGDGVTSRGAGTIQRQGNQDHNTAADFAWIDPESKGIQNEGLSVPFVGGGVMPNGLSIDGATGMISGSPTEVGSFDFAVRVVDSADPAHAVTKEFHLDVVVLPPLIVDVPSDATEGDGSVVGSVRIPEALAANLTVALQSDDTTEATVPDTVTILAGRTSATFEVTIADDSELDWIRHATITASADQYAGRFDTIAVHDDETASLTVDLPAGAVEGNGRLVRQGIVTADRAPTSDVIVELVSDDPTEVTVPPLVTIPAGQTTVTFDLMIVDDDEIDGTRSAKIVARVENWTEGSRSIDVADNDNDLFVTLPLDAWEGDGVLAGAGKVSIINTLPGDLVVALICDGAEELGIPPAVTIPAGATFVTFDLTIGDDDAYDGRQAATVTADAGGFNDGSRTISIGDNEIHRFAFDVVDTPQTASEPFVATITARDVDGETIRVFADSVALSGRLAGGTNSTVVVSELSPGSPDRAEFTNVSGADVDISKWQVVVYDRNSGTSPLVTLTIPPGTVCPAGGMFVLSQNGTSPGAYPNFFTGADISWRDDSAAGVLLLDAAGNVVDFVAAGALNPAEISDPLIIVPDCWQGSQVPSLPSEAFSYQRIGSTDSDTGADWRVESPTLGVVNPGLMLPFLDGGGSVPVAPPTAGPFVQGVWSGPVTVEIVQTGVVLTADDGAFHVGISSVFDVLPGALHHFDFAPIDSAQYVDVPFPVVLTAVDAHGYAIADFNDSVRLSGRAGVGGALPVVISPTQTASFTEGVWTGNVTVHEEVGAMYLRADDLGGHFGDSDPFDVQSVLPLLVTVPEGAAEGDGVVEGTVGVPFALGLNLTVDLLSSDPTEATVPPTATILAGQAEATFQITIVDDVELDWIRTVAISARATGYGGRSGTMAVHDNETAVLSVHLPAMVAEGDGVLTGQVLITAAQTLTSDVMVELSSDDATEALVPNAVRIPAGQTSAWFDLAILDDLEIDGTQTVTIAARVENWTDGSTAIDVADNEDLNLLLTLPPIAWEGDGTLDNAATVSISGTLPADLAVSLASLDTSEVSVPAAVTIPAGNTSARFDLTVVDDVLCDGAATAAVAASAAGFLDGSGTMRIADDDVHHFTFDGIASRQLAGEPFPVTIRARDLNGDAILVYEGGVGLRGSGSGGDVPVAPAGPVALLDGVWTGDVVVHATDGEVTLAADDGLGHAGASNVFAAVPGPIDHFQFSDFSSPQYASMPLRLTLTARDVHGYVATDFADSVELDGWIGSGSGSTVVISEVDTYGDAIEFTNVSGTNLDISGWQVLVYHHDNFELLHALTIPAATICPAGDVFTINERGTPPGNYPNFDTGVNIVWTRTTATGVLLLDAAGDVVDFMAASGLDPTQVTDPIAVVPDYWQGSQIPSQPSYSYPYQRTGDADTDGAGDWICDSSSLGSVNPGLQVPFTGGAVPIAVNPQVTTPFVDGVWTGEITIFQEAADMHLRADDGNGHFSMSHTFDVHALADFSVVGQHVFYNDSHFDGDDSDSNARDDDAIAPNVVALRPGQAATKANYVNYSRGINGIMVDIDGPVGVLSVDDFEFRVGNDHAPEGWDTAPVPRSIRVRPGEGDGGCDRVTIVWEDRAIVGLWLQVTVFATDDTRLAADYVFYFGSAVGEVGNSAGDARVNAVDVLMTRNNPHGLVNPAAIDNDYDFNRDGRVNAADMLIARRHQTDFLNSLQLIGLSDSVDKVVDQVFSDGVPRIEESRGPDSQCEMKAQFYRFAPFGEVNRPPQRKLLSKKSADQTVLEKFF